MYAALFGSVLTLSLWGCKKRNTAEQQETTATTTKTISASHAPDGSSTILGDRLINPYTVGNMEQAKRNLEGKGIYPKNAYTVRETHLYVKFKPKNEEEYNILRLTKSLDLYDFPLDYDIVVLGNWYREPSLGDSTPTPQYATVPSDFIFNDNVSYEIVDRLYIPEEDEQLMGARLDLDFGYLDVLLNETYGFNPPNNRWVRDLHPVETGANDGGGVVAPMVL